MCKTVAYCHNIMQRYAVVTWHKTWLVRVDENKDGGNGQPVLDENLLEAKKFENGMRVHKYKYRNVCFSMTNCQNAQGVYKLYLYLLLCAGWLNVFTSLTVN